ncbi:HlyD family efflux transporter periplasmic adaptor subunit [Mesobacterium sp. TK19101]|uniref:HlyD family efflux transporter periplasmic adaptor subunit n=1 Tax=Mesobacterium hydrothermale TaxID=3111907 RepID=A0ABU6HJ80_9RHOB|nr:HlyD family efflux transporter periplasmic adaptor subunit [Mesobacterium sp. TK19101]MEC3862515.1 HlyD family efflux transporter periplasmic adaptor subunit [Mesobacterium sp. TK19101]
MAEHRKSRTWTTVIAVLIVAAGLVYAFWPRATLVDIGTVGQGPMRVTIDEEGRTQVRNAYVVSTPIAGKLLRLTAEVGDDVIKGETIVARMQPSAPAMLDVRTREQADAGVTAAQAALRVAEADVNKARADRDLAQADFDRTQTLFGKGIASQSALDAARRGLRAAEATLDTTRAAVSMRVAELNNAQAQLLTFDDRQLGEALQTQETIPLMAPASGTILQVMQESETTVAAGTPIMEIGDIARDLEVRVDLLSTDAVQVRVGQQVLIDDWGGPQILGGEIRHIAPFGFTKVSALGVEEQRVTTTIRFTGAPEARAGLGHGFRVEARIVTWSAETAVTVPASALYRKGDGWALYVVENGTAQEREVAVEANNGLSAAISRGVTPGDAIILYPPSGLLPGTKVAQRQTN